MGYQEPNSGPLEINAVYFFGFCCCCLTNYIGSLFWANVISNPIEQLKEMRKGGFCCFLILFMLINAKEQQLPAYIIQEFASPGLATELQASVNSYTIICLFYKWPGPVLSMQGSPGTAVLSLFLSPTLVWTDLCPSESFWDYPGAREMPTVRERAFPVDVFW